MSLIHTIQALEKGCYPKKEKWWWWSKNADLCKGGQEGGHATEERRLQNKTAEFRIHAVMTDYSIMACPRGAPKFVIRHHLLYPVLLLNQWSPDNAHTSQEPNTPLQWKRGKLATTSGEPGPQTLPPNYLKTVTCKQWPGHYEPDRLRAWWRKEVLFLNTAIQGQRGSSSLQASKPCTWKGSESDSQATKLRKQLEQKRGKLLLLLPTPD